MSPTSEHIAQLNAGQQDRRFHPLTCGGNRGDDAHRAYALEHGDRDWGLLVATADGWACPVCDYRQPFDASPPPPSDPFISHLEHASEVVAKWPAWKQQLLGGVASPER